MKDLLIASVVHAETLETRLFLLEVQSKEKMTDALRDAIRVFCTTDEKGNNRSVPYDSDSAWTTAFPYSESCGINASMLGLSLSQGLPRISQGNSTIH